MHSEALNVVQRFGLDPRVSQKQFERWWLATETVYWEIRGQQCRIIK